MGVKGGDRPAWVPYKEVLWLRVYAGWGVAHPEAEFRSRDRAHSSEARLWLSIGQIVNPRCRINGWSYAAPIQIRSSAPGSSRTQSRTQIQAQIDDTYKRPLSSFLFSLHALTFPPILQGSAKNRSLPHRTLPAPTHGPSDPATAIPCHRIFRG